jgi:hypothetical protein
VKKIVAAALLLLTLSSCADPAQPTPTVVTPIPTPAATATRTPPPVPAMETPTAQATSAWNGIPIMPGAIAGEGDEEGYVFTIRTTPAQVQEYYQLELGRLGWQSVSQEQGDSSLILLFMNNASATITVSIISKGDQVLVLLVK